MEINLNSSITEPRHAGIIFITQNFIIASADIVQPMPSVLSSVSWKAVANFCFVT